MLPPPTVFVGFLVAFFPIVIDTATGLNAVEPKLIDLTRALSATEWQTLWRIRFPHALPFFFSGLKVSITLAVIGAVIGEFVGANQGLGYLILTGTAELKTAFVFACMFLLSVIGIGLFAPRVAVERFLNPWHASQRSHAMGSQWEAGRSPRRPALPRIGATEQITLDVPPDCS